MKALGKVPHLHRDQPHERIHLKPTPTPTSKAGHTTRILSSSGTFFGLHEVIAYFPMEAVLGFWSLQCYSLAAFSWCLGQER